jgi:hypothetical protein
MAVATMLSELREFVGFDGASERRLQKLRPHMRKFFPGIVARFYDAILCDPVARGVFQSEEQISRSAPGSGACTSRSASSSATC